MNATVAKPRRLRFSLRSLLALLVAVAMVFTIALQRMELVALRKDAARLRSEVGELTITDKSQIHIIAVPMAAPNEFVWRVYLPRERYYELELQADPRGWPEYLDTPVFGSVAFWQRDREFLVRIVLRNDGIYGNVDGLPVTLLSASEHDLEFFRRLGLRYSAVQVGIGQRQGTFPPDEPIELLQYREPGSMPNERQLTPGFAVQIAPARQG